MLSKLAKNLFHIVSLSTLRFKCTRERSLSYLSQPCVSSIYNTLISFIPVNLWLLSFQFKIHINPNILTTLVIRPLAFTSHQATPSTYSSTYPSTAMSQPDGDLKHQTLSVASNSTTLPSCENAFHLSEDSNPSLLPTFLPMIVTSTRSLAVAIQFLLFLAFFPSNCFYV